MPDEPPPHWRSWKGDVIRSIVSQERPLTWTELRQATGLEEKSLNTALSELLSAKEIYKTVGRRFKVSSRLYSNYADFIHKQKNELVEWIDKWKEVRTLDFTLEHKHFFLEGRHLDDFSKELIAHAKSEVLIVNPFIQDCDLSNTLKDAKDRGIKVVIVTRPPSDRSPEYLKSKQEYHRRMESVGIIMFHSEKVHAKLIVVDQTVTIVSSMNFYADSSAGVSWEAGLISTDERIAKTITDISASKLA